MDCFAQTNIQLYNQLQSLNYSTADIHKAAIGYRLAVDLFTGQYRGNGKPFINHLVGTASILASVSQPLDVVCAGLLHAAYMQGDFGTKKKGITPDKQNILRSAIGAPAESYVDRYTKVQNSSEKLDKYLKQSVTDIDESEKSIIVMCLANTLEDHLDLGMVYSSSAKRANNAARIDLEIDLAKQLGYVTLAQNLSKVKELNLKDDIALPEFSKGRKYSHTVIPKSCRKRFNFLI